MFQNVSAALHACRYAHLHGKHVVHPLDGRKIPIITDAELVDMSFGTGAVKITPAHDPNDFATGKRHGLAFVNILTNDGAINERGGQFAKQPRFQVRAFVACPVMKCFPRQAHAQVRCAGTSSTERCQHQARRQQSINSIEK